MDRYAVFGNPIAQSKSPLIHKLFAEQTHQALSYDSMLVELDSFSQAVTEFFADGGMGLNVTVPFKLEAWQIVDDCCARASRARAVNTIKREANGDLFGTNTDGLGLCRDLQNNLGWQVAGRRILIIGAGGAVRGVLGPLFDLSPQSIVINNRTPEKAEQLCAEFAALGDISCSSPKGLRKQRFDLVINASAASLSGELPDVPGSVFAGECRAYDMFYAARKTAFLRWADNHGAQECADGLGMLVEQAAESFALWRETRPETTAVIARVRADLEHSDSA